MLNLKGTTQKSQIYRANLVYIPKLKEQINVVYLKIIPPEHLMVLRGFFPIGETLFVIGLNVLKYGVCDIPITKPIIDYCE